VAIAAPERLYFTGDDEADALIAQDPLALLIGFSLDQQVSVQKAFSGPLALRERLGSLDADTLAQADLEPVFRERPAIHRFPGAMAERVQSLCRYLAENYDGDGSRVWTQATSGQDMVKRIGALPGFGDMKVRSLVATLVKQFGVKPDGWEQVLPSHPTLGDADTPEALAAYQAAKREHKRQVRAQRERKE
jgi:uncharacterized HhH-GPD family protein